MKVAFLRNEHLREQLLANALKRGLSAHKDRLEIIPYDDDPHDVDCDIIAFVGLKCREWHQFCKETGKPFLYFDKGYYYQKEKNYNQGKRILKCWRAAVGETQPLQYLTDARHNMRRWDKFGQRPKPWRDPTHDGHVILAGSSLKYHMFNGLPHPTDYFVEVVRQLREYTDRPIHYRPKPSWRDATPIEGTEFVPTDSFESRARGAHAIITHGSNAALIGMLSGVPSVILGNGVMAPISSTDLSEIENPYLAAEEERLQLLANLAHSQFTLDEMAQGDAWHNLKILYQL